MNRFKLSFIIIFITQSLAGLCSFNTNNDLPSPDEVIQLIIKVNDYYQEQNSYHGNAFWDTATYHTGNIAAYKITGKEEYLNYSKKWAEHNQWKGAASDDTSEWKYCEYGETHDYVLFGDWQICFQTYIDIFNLEGQNDQHMVERAREVMHYQVNTDVVDYWWWADALYMVMPVMVKMYHLTGEQIYLDKLYEYFSYTKKIMYDEESGLFFRDAKYIYPNHTSINGEKDFWSRGNGWVFASIARILDELPNDYQYREIFIEIYKKMANTLKSSQQEEGYWTRSIFDPNHAPGPETSGTAFYLYGFLWGINHGILAEEEYFETIEKSWNYLANYAIDENGKVGYVQPIGEQALPDEIVDKNSTSNFGVGATLLAATEMYKYTIKE